jgi:hypothetical protein
MGIPRVFTWASLACLAGLAAGCGSSASAVKTVPVAGTVYLDGKPLPGVSVVFISPRAEFVGMGTTGHDGKYRLTRSLIPGKHGAMPGTNQVHFAEVDPNPPSEPPMIPASSSTPPRLQGNALPARYCNPERPELTFDVPDQGTDSADFRLTSK